MMLRGCVVVLVALSLATATSLGAGTVRSWSMASADEFALGTLEGTALDGDGRIVVAPALVDLWGPTEGIVWDVATDGEGGAFVAVSSPTRVLHVVPGSQPESWHETGDETLVAAILPDSAGGLYFGLSPDGRLIHASGPGTFTEVADSEALFIWALAASPDGSVWIGTGLPGRLLRVDPAGETHAVFEAGDDPVRCIVAQEDGGIVFGTGGRGRVVRVDRDARPFVLFDADEAEIVALAATDDGTVYALTAQGSKQIAAARSASAAPNATVRVTATAPESENKDDGRDEREEPRDEAAQRRTPPRRFQTPPGGALYRIASDGDAQRIWQAAGEVPFGLVRRDDGMLLVATGDAGRLWAIDDAGRSSILVELASDQASALARDAAGSVLLGGTTDARVVRIGPELRDRGYYVGPVHDAGAPADWGRLRWEADRPAGSEVRAAVRGGNSAEPDETWTDWIPLAGDGSVGALTEMPPTRWLQTRLELVTRRGASPGVRSVELFYQPFNRRPAIAAMSVHPAGVVWSRSAAQAGRPAGPLVAKDPVARKTVAGLRPATGIPKPVRKSYELGARTVSWQATDVDADRLRFRLDIRREATASWIPLVADLDGDFFGWDTRGMPDGLYRVRLVASDSTDNPEGKELVSSRTSAAFRIDNTRPSVGRPQIQHDRGRYEVEFVVSDPGGNVAIAEVAVDTGEWEPLEPLDGVADSAEETYQVVLEPLAQAPDDGPRTVKVRVTDSAGNMGGEAWALEEDDR